MKNMLFILVTFSLPLSFSTALLGGYDSEALAERSDSRLLEVGQASKTFPAEPAPSEIKSVSYNIRWRSGEELRKLARLLKDDPEIGGARIIGLQEVDRHKARSQRTNTAKFLAEELGMYYAWAAPPTVKPNDEEETGVTILSSYPLTDIRRIVLPHPGPGKRRRVALGATVSIGSKQLRVYSVHSENRMAVDKKLEQTKAVLHDLAKYSKDMRAIVLGDLNTWEPASVNKTFKLFREADLHTPFDEESTFFRRVLFVPIKLKLDWIWLRGCKALRHGIDREIELSDHWPLWVVLDLKSS